MMRSRTDVLQDQSLQGVEFCHALSLVVDEWLIEIFDEACVQLKPKGSVALVAVGGYGREELAPFSDLDLLLLHDSVKKIDEFAAKIWYPIWDSGFKLGHAVRTKKETLRLASQDLDTATGILTARYLAGDQRLADDLISNGRRNWSEKGRGWLSELHRRVLERHRKAGEIAFLLEPDLKEGMGGLRDIQTIWWALGAGLVLSTEDRTVLEHCYELLTKARVALHRTTSQPGDILHLDDQDAVASALGFISADVLMAELATAGRQVMWVADEAWARLDPPQSIGVQLLAPGVEMRDGFVHLEDDADPSADPTLV